MKVFNKIVALLIALIVISCGSHSDNHKQHSDKNHENNHAHHRSEPHLDNGKKWQANPETTEGINNMIEMIQTYSNEDIMDHRFLSDSLNAEYNMIFRNCTMKGEAHNQLHAYLLPIQEMLNGMSSSNADTSKFYFEKLEKYMPKYTKYFK